MSHASVSLQALFRLPETAALDPALRALLDAHAGSGHEAIVLREPLPLLADTLESLSRLDADAEMMGAAVVFATGDWAAPLMASLEKKHPRVHALVDGLQASGQVWDLHAERGGSGNQEGLRRLLLAIVRDLRVVPILLAQQLARKWYNANARLFELTGTIWENVSPEQCDRPKQMSGREFCGWSALAPVTLPVEFGWLRGVNNLK